MSVENFLTIFILLFIAFIISYLRGTNDISRGSYLAELQFISLRLNRKKEDEREPRKKQNEKSRRWEERSESINEKRKNIHQEIARRRSKTA